MVPWQAVFLAASLLMTAPPSIHTRLYYNGSAPKSHSTTTQYRQLRRLLSTSALLHTRCESFPPPTPTVTPTDIPTLFQAPVLDRFGLASSLVIG